MKNCIKKYLSFFIICIILTSASMPVYAKTTKKITVKKVYVRSNDNVTKVKVKISNKYKKKEATYGEEFYVYKKEDGNWKKIEWSEGYSFDDREIAILPKKTAKRVFTIRQKYLSEKLEKNKTYKIVFKVSGYKKSIKFKLK